MKNSNLPMKYSIFFLIAVFITSFIQCRRTSPLACTAYALEISDELTAFSNAASAFSSNPSEENCLKYKEAGADYIDALKEYRNCPWTGVDRDQYDADLEEAEDEIASLDCN